MTTLQTMVDAYIRAVYFTETGDTDQPSGDAELTDLFKAHAYLQCRQFYWAVTDDLCVPRLQIHWSQVGHDLWLTRNGHGAGFWDRSDDAYGEGPNGEQLKIIFTAMAKAMGPHDAEWKK